MISPYLSQLLAVVMVLVIKTLLLGIWAVFLDSFKVHTTLRAEGALRKAEVRGV